MSTTAPRKFVEDATAAIRTAVESWMLFWFKPADPLPLGIIRVFTGGMLVYNLLIWGVDFRAFFAADSLQPLKAVADFSQYDFVFSFWHWVSDDWLITAHWTCVLVAALFCLGVLTRVTSVLAFLITISYSQRVPVANFGLDQILGMSCLYLAIGPSGACLSVDRWVRERWGKKAATATPTPKSVPQKTTAIPMLPSAQMALRLFQIHMCVIYFWAGFSKLKGDSWWTGEAMWQVLASLEYQTADLTWTAWVPWLPYLVAHVTVAWEVSFCVLVWNSRLRPLCLAIGTAMHMGIGAFLGLWTFGLIMTFPYFAFSDGNRWRRRRTLFSSADDDSASVDDSESTDAASMEVVVPESEESTAAVDVPAEEDPWAASEPFVTADASSVTEEILEEAALSNADVSRAEEPTSPQIVESNEFESTGDLVDDDAESSESVSVEPASLKDDEQPLNEEVTATVEEKLDDATADTEFSPAAEKTESVESSLPEGKTAPSTVAELPESTEWMESPDEPTSSKDDSVETVGRNEDDAERLFRELMGVTEKPVRIKPAKRRRLGWNSVRQADLEFPDVGPNHDSDPAPTRFSDVVENKTMNEHVDQYHAGDEEEAVVSEEATVVPNGFDIDAMEENESMEGTFVMDDDMVIVGQPAPVAETVIPVMPAGLFDSATPSDETDGDEELDSAVAITHQAEEPEENSSEPFDPDQSITGVVVMSESTDQKNESQDSPDAEHVMTTSARMDRIRPKTANSLTGAPPPQVDGRVEDSVLAPETEVLLVAAHAPERNTFRTYLRRHDIPCRAAVSAENAVSVVLNMKPAVVLISGSMMNPEEIITLVDDLNDMVDAPILCLLTGSQIKQLSNDPLAAHVLQFPASLRQVRSELTTILLGEANARPRCSLRAATLSE